VSPKKGNIFGEMRSTRGAELEADVRLYLTSGPAAVADPARRARAERAIAWLKEHAPELARRGLVSFGERPAALHLAPALADRLADQLSS
jgi:hypothetical protein